VIVDLVTDEWVWLLWAIAVEVSVSVEAAGHFAGIVRCVVALAMLRAARE
jgi:hypothetical protein